MERRLSGILRSYDLLIESDDDLVRTTELLDFLGVKVYDSDVLKEIQIKLKCTSGSNAIARVIGNDPTRRLIIPKRGKGDRRDVVNLLYEYIKCIIPKEYPGYGWTNREILSAGHHVVPKVPSEILNEVSGVYCSVLRRVGTDDSLHCTYCDLYRCDCTLYNFCTPRTIENKLIFKAVASV